MTERNVQLEKLLKGIYVLIIQVTKPIQTSIGVIGEFTFAPGLYAYVGSAQNNLEKRVARHKRRNKTLFWHIDYLLDHDAATVAEVYYKPADKSGECSLARTIAEKAESIKGFGCSDCQCTSHLFHTDSFEFLGNYASKL